MCLWIFQNCVFSQNFVGLCLFRLIQYIFRSIESVLKLFKEASAYFDWSKLILDQSKLFWNFFKFLKKPLSVSINQNWFSINQNLWIRFFKNQSLTFQTYFSKRFSNFFLSLRIGQGYPTIFVIYSDFLQGFPLHKPVSLLCPSFCILIHVFMHFFGYFWNFSNWDFCWFKLFF